MEHARKKITYHKKSSKPQYTVSKEMNEETNSNEYIGVDIYDELDMKDYIDNSAALIAAIKESDDYFSNTKEIRRAANIKQDEEKIIKEIHMMQIELKKLKKQYEKLISESNKIKDNGVNSNTNFFEVDPDVSDLLKTISELEKENQLLKREINGLNYKKENNTNSNYDKEEMEHFIKDEISRMKSLLCSNFRVNTNNYCVPNVYKKIIQN